MQIPSTHELINTIHLERYKQVLTDRLQQIRQTVQDSASLQPQMIDILALEKMQIELQRLNLEESYKQYIEQQLVNLQRLDVLKQQIPEQIFDQLRAADSRQCSICRSISCYSPS